MSSRLNLIEESSIISEHKDNKPIKKRKILVLGSPGVGKSAIVTRFMDDVFYDFYNPSLQNSFKKLINFNNDTLELEIVDLEGQSEHTIISYSRFSYGISGYILCYSIENGQSFELINLINNKLNCNFGRHDVPRVLIANKSDLNNRREITIEAGKKLAKEINCPFIEVSARNRDNIDRLFHTLLVEIDKFESDFNPRKISCRKLIEYFAQRESTLIIFLYIFIIINMVKNKCIEERNNKKINFIFLI
jgi:small GTP-binding protein